MIASPTRLFAHSPADNTLWDVAPDFSSVGVSALNTVLPATNVLSVALSNELPSAQYLFALIGSGSQASIYRVGLTTNTVNSQASAALGPGTLQFSIVPPETNPTGFIQYNATQNNLAPGAKTLPLIARVLDPTGARSSQYLYLSPGIPRSPSSRQIRPQTKTASFRPSSRWAQRQSLRGIIP